MKRLKQLSLILFISVGLFSCEAEKADEKITDEYLQGKQIFRCEVDGVTRVTDNVNVSSNGAYVYITAKLLSVNLEEATKFRYDTFTIAINKLATGTYLSKRTNAPADPFLGIASANYKLINKNWEYSTDNLENGNGTVIQETGSITISNINEKAQYFSGEFEFDMYAPKRENPNNTIAPIRVRNGSFEYIKYN